VARQITAGTAAGWAVSRLEREHALANLVGADPGFAAAVDRLPAIAASDATVLITGETGTGKELFARAVHYLSPRAARPFVAVNCGAISDSLLEDELFGHERGAFTDARARRTGVLEAADGGTLFLDEVSSMSGRAQAALLRVIQERSFRRLGSSTERRVDLRIVTATNVPLDALVVQGALRADLYYRVNVLPVHLPPLRERTADILRLARHFLDRHARSGSSVPRLTVEAEAALLAHDWPGNVRELENTIVRGMSFAREGEIGLPELGLRPAAPPPFPLESADAPSSFRDLKRRAIATFEHEYLQRVMTEHRGNVSRAARTAGKERREFGKLLKRHRLDPQDFAEPSSPR
jgi:DNA-binding NtrC family response regulator